MIPCSLGTNITMVRPIKTNRGRPSTSLAHQYHEQQQSRADEYIALATQTPEPNPGYDRETTEKNKHVSRTIKQCGHSKYWTAHTVDSYRVSTSYRGHALTNLKSTPDHPIQLPVRGGSRVGGWSEGAESRTRAGAGGAGFFFPGGISVSVSESVAMADSL